MASGQRHHGRPNQRKRILLRNITQNYLTNQMRRDFVANASHELRTPLTIIVGYLENLMEDDLVEESPGLARNHRSHAPEQPEADEHY
ncbi:MAG: histidine kinase dimerization/phospho-acceptor domain-containing protein [Akkermansia sp.]